MNIPTTTAMPNTVEHHAGRRHHFRCLEHAFSKAQNLAKLFDFFDFFNFSTCRSFVTTYSSFFNRPSLIASYALSDPPGPLFISVVVVVTYIAVAIS